MRIACIIPTYNSKTELDRLLDSLHKQNTIFTTLIIDSSSEDGTYELAKERVANVVTIPSSEFNHGGTRQKMVDINPDFDLYVFMTQDAYLSDSESITKIVKFFIDPTVAAVCGRQLPHINSTMFAQHARYFNYPNHSLVKSNSDIPRFGIKTAFMSNSFSAYRSNALKEIGGFPNHVIFAEDMYVAAKMVLNGWKIAYVGNAECHHSHNYTIMEEFNRYFDMGVFHAREPWIRQNFGGAGGEGLRYQFSELFFLGFKHWYLWPISILRNIVKLLGYKMGQQEDKLPIKLKRKLSMYKAFWDGAFAQAKNNYVDLK